MNKLESYVILMVQQDCCQCTAVDHRCHHQAVALIQLNRLMNAWELG